jgi:hypothetical protein
MHKKKMSLSFLLASYPFFTSCGSSTNLNQIWGDDNAADSLLLEAQSAYDRGDFNKAEKISSNLVERSPDHEEAAVLLGYIHLSQGGFDPYRVASCLIEISSPSSNSKNESNCNSKGSATLKMVDEKVSELIDTSFYAEKSDNYSFMESASSDSSDVTDLLKKLQSGLLNLTSEDFADLQEKQFEGTSDIFKSNPILVPKKVTDELRAKVFVLEKMNQVIKNVCRFVNEDTEIKSDSERYKKMGCTLTSQPRKVSAKAHYLWAVAHLAESLIYQSVILYDTSSSSTSNIQAASDALNNYSGDINRYITAVSDLRSALDSVFDTEDPSSMISACLNDLTSVNGAFAAIVGMPDGVRQQLSKIMEKIKELAKNIGGSSSQSNQTRALKSQMTEKITEKVASQTNEAVAKVIESKTGKKVDPNSVTPATVEKLDANEKQQIKSLCTTYDNLAKDFPNDKKSTSKPKACS